MLQRRYTIYRFCEKFWRDTHMAKRRLILQIKFWHGYSANFEFLKCHFIKKPPSGSGIHHLPDGRCSEAEDRRTGRMILRSAVTSPPLLLPPVVSGRPAPSLWRRKTAPSVVACGSHDLTLTQELRTQIHQLHAEAELIRSKGTYNLSLSLSLSSIWFSAIIFSDTEC